MNKEKRFFGGGQSTSYFAARRKQLNRSESAVEPMGIPMVKEMIQNADDRKAEELFLVFTEESLWITNDGETFNYNESQDDEGNRVSGDLANLLGVAQSLAEAEEDRVGRHGTGFELIYCIANRFEIHWWDRIHGDRVSMRSNPEFLESGASETWDYPWEHGDFDAYECPFDIEERDEVRRGVLFKADWRTNKQAEKEYGEHGPIFKNAAFPQWDKSSRKSFFESCKAYAPFMIQFCKSITNISIIWLEKGNSEFFRSSREYAYPTSKYAGNAPGEFDCEIVEIGFESGSCDNKSVSRGFSGVEKEIRNLWGKTRNSDYQIRLLHGWASVHGTTGPPNNMHMDREKVLTSWKFPTYSQFHTHNQFDCPHCPMRNQDGWIPDRTSVVHIHFPLDSISDELGQLEKPGQTLLHSILPLGVVSPNLFMVSADLYVNEGRAQLEFQDDKGVWNSCSALTAFWLHSQMMEWICGDERGKAEEAILQALPADSGNWFGSLNLSSNGFPDGDDLLGEGMRSELYFNFGQKSWILDTNDELVAPLNVVIPTNENEEYDDEIKAVLEALGLSVMRRETHKHILSTGSYVLDNLRNLLRKSRIYDPGLSHDMSEGILAKVESSNLNDLSIDSKLALARMVNHLDSDFTGAVYPDANGKLRNRAEFSTIPNGLSVLQELQGERPSLHPGIEDIFEPGETSVQDALRIIQRMQENDSERFDNLGDDDAFLDILMRMADQILADSGITDQDRIMYDFIPCRIGERVFVRAYQHLVKCPNPQCECNNPPIMDGRSDCVECGQVLLREDSNQRIPLQTGRPEDWSRMHIMSPDNQDIPDEVSERIVTACSPVHFSDKLADSVSKVGLMRYLGKKGGNARNYARQESLFHEEVLNEWLNLEGDSDAVPRCRTIFLNELRVYAKTGGRTNLRGLFNDSPIFYDHDRNWALASEFILYIDDVTLDMLQGGESSVRTPHPELLDENPDENDWMTLSELGGAKKNVEFEHLEAAIRGLLGETLGSYGVDTEAKCRSLASIATHLIRHNELLEDTSDEFNDLRWVPIGLQDGFDTDADVFCKWSEFPLPGPLFDAVWGPESENPHIKLEGELVSPHQFFDEVDLVWMRERQEADSSWASSVGMGSEPSAERMFLSLVSSSDNSSGPLSEGVYGLLEGIEDIPDRFADRVYRFYHPGSGEWHEGVGENTLLVDSQSDKLIIGGDCIQTDGLRASALNLLEIIIGCKRISTGSGSSEAISRLSSRWEDLAQRQLSDATILLRSLWKTFHDSDVASEQIDCWREGQSVMFPLGNSVVAVDDIVICPETSGLSHFVGRAGIFTIANLAHQEDEEYELHRTPLSLALRLNGALDWGSFVLQLGEDGGYVQLPRITQLRDRLGLGEQMISEEDGFAWADSMMEVDWWYSESRGESVLPIPYWRGAELVIDIARGDEVYFVTAGSPHEDKVGDFRLMGLQLLHLGLGNDEKIMELEGRTSKEGPFPDFGENLEQQNMGLSSTDRDVFPPLADYMGDLLTAIQHRFERSLEGEDPLLFLGELIECYRTNKRLQVRWVVGDIEVIRGERYYTIEGSFSDPPIWPHLEVTYRTQVIEDHRKMIVESILRQGLKARLDRENEAGMDERTRLGNALGREEVRPGDIIEIVSGLLAHANPRRWEEVPGFERIWDENSPRLDGDLILNPNVQEARERILAWYNDAGCQLCGQLTPDGPGRESYEESRAQIFKSQGTKYVWKSATEQGGDVGNWLYLCPTHFKLHTKRCLELLVLVGDDEVELEDLVVLARNNQEVISSIADDRIYANIYERRGSSDVSPWDDEGETGASWSGIRQIQRIEGEHAKRIVEKIKSYVRQQIG